MGTPTCRFPGESGAADLPGPRSVRHHTVHDLQQNARPGGQGDSGDIEDRGLARRRPEALPRQDARLPDADVTQR